MLYRFNTSWVEFGLNALVFIDYGFYWNGYLIFQYVTFLFLLNLYAVSFITWIIQFELKKMWNKNEIHLLNSMVNFFRIINSVTNLVSSIVSYIFNMISKKMFQIWMSPQWFSQLVCFFILKFMNSTKIIAYKFLFSWSAFRSAKDLWTWFTKYNTVEGIKKWEKI